MCDTGGTTGWDVINWTGDGQAEVDLLARCSHPHIIRYLGTEVDHGSLEPAAAVAAGSGGESLLYIFSEWVPGGSVSSVIKRES
eukprot:SAG22_NODE_690_length_7891_cov_11.959322_3_plen_84_part_00